MLLLPLCFTQGIKFYDPEIVGDTPEAVEYKGLQNIVDMVAQQLGLEQGKVCCICQVQVALGLGVM
jgi:chromosome condensin MukBEF complex kleisin-like MukF subunit